MSVFVSVCMLFLLPQLIKPSQSDINKDYMCVLFFNATLLVEAGFVQVLFITIQKVTSHLCMS